MLYRKLPRLVVTLLYKNGAFYNSREFKRYDYLGDPLNIIQLLNSKNCMEATILNLDEGPIDFAEFKTLASEAFMPMSYGGSIQNIRDASRIISLGYEKIVFKDSDRGLTLANEVANKFGAQAVSICINYNRPQKMIDKINILRRISGNDNAQEIKDRLNRVEKYSFGEILLQNMSADGMQMGYDVSLIPFLKNIRVPILLSGGSRGLSDVLKINRIAPWMNFAGTTSYTYSNGGILVNYPTQESLLELKNSY